MLKQYRLSTSFDQESARTEMILSNGGVWLRVSDHEADKAAAVEQATRELRDNLRDAACQLLAIHSLTGNARQDLNDGEPGWSPTYMWVRERCEQAERFANAIGGAWDAMGVNRLDNELGDAIRELRAEKDAAKREAESIREQSNRQLLAILSLLGDMPAYLSQGDHGWSVAYQGVRERLESSKAVEAMLHDDPAVPSHGPAPLTDAERDARIRRLERRVVGQGTNRDFAAIEADVKAGK